MIYRRIISSLCGIMVILASFYIIEAASFRLVEPYAKFRLKLCWGDYLDSKENPFLRKLPLDHFCEPRTSVEEITFSEAINEELEYSKKILSFLRPVRDRAANYLHNQIDPLSSHEIRDLGLIKSVVLPGLNRPATMHDLDEGAARRIGDKIEFADCLFVYLTISKSSNEFEDLFARLEHPFGFLADHGFACLLMPVSSKEALEAQINYLQSNYNHFADNILVYGQGKLAAWVLQVAQKEPGIFKACILEDPIVDTPPPPTDGSQWLLSLVKNHKGLDPKLLQWTRSSRAAEYFYPSRLAGLIYGKVQDRSEPLSSLALSYMLQCQDYLNIAGHHWVKSSPLDESETEFSSKEQKFNPNEMNENMYLCEAVKEYRLLHRNDRSIMELSNQELILKIGEAIEALGPTAVAQLSEKDPEFIILYQSLKEID